MDCSLGGRWPAAYGWGIFAVAVAVYTTALPNALLWDDLHLIVHNPAIKHWSNALSLLTSDLFPAGILSAYYRPVQALTYLLDYKVWALEPVGYHLTSIVLHACVAVLFGRTVAQLLDDARAGLIAALLFAVHPIHTEAVAYVAGRSDPLSALGLLAALLWAGRGAPVKAAAAFAFALLSREAALVFPLLLLLSTWFVAGRSPGGEAGGTWRRARWPLLSCGIVLVAYLGWRFWIIGIQSAGASPARVGLALRLATMTKVIVAYLGLLLAPVHLHMERLVEPARLLSAPLVVGPGLLLAGILAAAVSLRKRARPLTFGLLWFFVALLPVANIVPLSTFMAEHWLYVPSMGIFLAAGWALAVLSRRGWEQPVASLVVIALAVYGGLTLRRNMDWRDGITLYRATLRWAPHSARAWTNLGRSYQEAGDAKGAEDAYRHALSLAPKAADVVQNLGTVAADRGQASAAGEAYRKAITMDPAMADPHNNLGNLYRTRGRYDEALREFETALALNPEHVAAHNNLALTLQALGRSAEARSHLLTALRLDPDSAVTHSNLGNVFFREGDFSRARNEYLAAIRLDPDYAEAHNNLGSVYFRSGRPQAAAHAYRTALRLNPGLAEVRKNLAVVLGTSRVPRPPVTPSPR